MKDQKTIKEQILIAEKELATLDAKRAALQKRIEQLRVQRQSIADEQFPFDRVLEPIVTNESNQEQKIALFRSLFRGRDDVFPGRFESKRTGKSGYQPVCRNEWIRPICKKPKIKCGDCENRDFIPLSDGIIRNHLIGTDPTDRDPVILFSLYLFIYLSQLNAFHQNVALVIHFFALINKLYTLLVTFMGCDNHIVIGLKVRSI